MVILCFKFYFLRDKVKGKRAKEEEPRKK